MPYMGQVNFLNPKELAKWEAERGARDAAKAAREKAKLQAAEEKARYKNEKRS